LIWIFTRPTRNPRKKEKEKKERKEKSFWAKPCRITIHVLSEDEEDVKTNQWYDRITTTTIRASRTSCQNKDDACEACANSFFFFFLLQKLKISLGLNNTNKQTISEITAKPLKSRLKNSNGKSNPVIQLFYKIWKYKNILV